MVGLFLWGGFPSEQSLKEKYFQFRYACHDVGVLSESTKNITCTSICLIVLLFCYSFVASEVSTILYVPLSYNFVLLYSIHLSSFKDNTLSLLSLNLTLIVFLFIKFVICQVEQFWTLYSHLARPCDLTSSSDYHLFKLGVKPMWEVCI